MNSEKMTMHNAKAICSTMGITLKKTGFDSEIRVNYRNGLEATAYYTDDLQDAVQTAQAMHRSGHPTNAEITADVTSNPAPINQGNGHTYTPDACRFKGVTIARSGNTIKVNFVGGTEATAFYTNNPQDALNETLRRCNRPGMILQGGAKLKKD